MKKMTKPLREALISTGWTEEWIAEGIEIGKAREERRAKARAERMAKAKVEESRKEERQAFVNLLKSGKSREEIIREYDTSGDS